MDFVSSSGVTDKTDVQNSPQVTVNTKTYVNSKYFNIFWLYAHVTMANVQFSDLRYFTGTD